MTPRETVERFGTGILYTEKLGLPVSGDIRFKPLEPYNPFVGAFVGIEETPTGFQVFKGGEWVDE